MEKQFPMAPSTEPEFRVWQHAVALSAWTLAWVCNQPLFFVEALLLHVYNNNPSVLGTRVILFFRNSALNEEDFLRLLPPIDEWFVHFVKTCVSVFFHTPTTQATDVYLAMAMFDQWLTGFKLLLTRCLRLYTLLTRCFEEARVTNAFRKHVFDQLHVSMCMLEKYIKRMYTTFSLAHVLEMLIPYFHAKNTVSDTETLTFASGVMDIKMFEQFSRPAMEWLQVNSLRPNSPKRHLIPHIVREFCSWICEMFDPSTLLLYLELVLDSSTAQTFPHSVMRLIVDMSDLSHTLVQYYGTLYITSRALFCGMPADLYIHTCGVLGAIPGETQLIATSERPPRYTGITGMATSAILRLLEGAASKMHLTNAKNKAKDVLIRNPKKKRK
jgi:hypothetical protein